MPPQLTAMKMRKWLMMHQLIWDNPWMQQWEKLSSQRTLTRNNHQAKLYLTHGKQLQQHKRTTILKVPPEEQQRTRHSNQDATLNGGTRQPEKEQKWYIDRKYSIFWSNFRKWTQPSQSTNSTQSTRMHPQGHICPYKANSNCCQIQWECSNTAQGKTHQNNQGTHQFKFTWTHTTTGRYFDSNKHMDDRRTGTYHPHSDTRRKSEKSLLAFLHHKTIKLQRPSPGDYSGHWNPNSGAFQTNQLRLKTGLKIFGHPPHGGQAIHQWCHDLTRTNIWRDQNEQISNDIPIRTKTAPCPTCLCPNSTKNLEGLDQVLKNQATFCKEITFATNNDVRDVDHKFILQIKREDTKWTLQKVLMQLVHPAQEECSFFHVTNWNRNGNSITIAMLPNIAQHGSTVVRHLLPFTKWILEPTLGHSQAKSGDSLHHGNDCKANDLAMGSSQ